MIWSHWPLTNCKYLVFPFNNAISFNNFNNKPPHSQSLGELFKEFQIEFIHINDSRLTNKVKSLMNSKEFQEGEFDFEDPSLDTEKLRIYLADYFKSESIEDIAYLTR